MNNICAGNSHFLVGDSVSFSQFISENTRYSIFGLDSISYNIQSWRRSISYSQFGIMITKHIDYSNKWLWIINTAYAVLYQHNMVSVISLDDKLRLPHFSNLDFMVCAAFRISIPLTVFGLMGIYFWQLAYSLYSCTAGLFPLASRDYL